MRISTTIFFFLLVVFLLVEPLSLGALPADDVTLAEPQGNLLLGVLDAVGAVADVAAGLESEVTLQAVSFDWNLVKILFTYTDGTGGRGEGVGGTEES